MALPAHRFSATQRELRGRFFEIIETTDEWTEVEPVAKGKSKSWRVRNNLDGMKAVAKPGLPRAAEDGDFRAAHEKLAFDLACLVPLPVCPVVLWPKDIGEIYKVGRSISCWAFPRGVKWSAAEARGLISAVHRKSVAPIVSAMHVFHTWIGDGDRKTDHVFVNLDSPPGRLEIAFFDHDSAMHGSWDRPNAEYLPGVPEDRAVTLETAQHIAGLADEDIARLVDRIPAAYLPHAPKLEILHNLLARRGNLPSLLGI
jgi:hypothetical protein